MADSWRFSPTFYPPSAVMLLQAQLYHDPHQSGFTWSSLVVRWSISRIAGGGSFSGPGYNCGVSANDTRSFGNSLCVPTDATYASEEGAGACVAAQRFSRI